MELKYKHIMANYVAVTLPQVLDVKNVISREILETSAGTNENIWEKMGIMFRTGIENMETGHIFDGNYNVAAPKYHGSELSSTLGEMLARRLVVKQIWSRIPDTLDNYYEKEPISMLSLSQNGVTGEHTQFQLLQAAKQTSSQVRRNLFLGKRPATKTAWQDLSDSQKELALYDGIFQKIADMKAGTSAENDQDANGNPLISAAKGNLIATDPLLAAATPVDTYDAMVDFYNQLDPHLLAEEVIYFYVCDRLFQRIKQGYNLKYNHMQTPDVNLPTFKFVDMPNVEFRHDPVYGFGDQVIATTENNLRYGTDITTDGEPSNAFVNIMQDQNDAHNIIIQMDLRAGTQIYDPTKGRFATNDKVNYASEALYEASLTD